MESLTITFTDEEWAELNAAADRSNVGVAEFAHDAVLVAARSHEAREALLRKRDEDRRLMREESAALMNDPRDRAAMRRVYEEMEGLSSED